MATTKQLIESALRSLGVLASGEEAQPAELQDALVLARDMLDGWSNERLMVPYLARDTLAMDKGRRYTLGPGGDLDGPRPLEIHHLFLRDPGGLDQPVTLTSYEQWASTRHKDTIEATPRYAWYDPQHPVGVLEFSTIPAAHYVAHLRSLKPLAQLPELTGSVEFPPGYSRAIRLGLALELAPEYGKQLDAVIPAQFRDAKMVLKRTNTDVATLRVDDGLVRRRGYDINQGPA